MAAIVFMTSTSRSESLLIAGFRALAVDPEGSHPEIQLFLPAAVVVVVDAFLLAEERRLLNPIGLIREVALQLEDLEVRLVVVADRHALGIGDLPRHLL